MILGLPEAVFLGVHITLSLVGVVTGIMVLFAMASGHAARAMTWIFLLTTILTSATGFPLPPFGLDPPRIVGIVSLMSLGIALIAMSIFHLRGAWRWIYVLTATFALWLNCFVGVVQAFQKIGFLNALAPLGSEPPFLVTQAALAGALIVLCILALMRFRPVEVVVHHDRVEHVTRP
jgi:hypothetical protein